MSNNNLPSWRVAARLLPFVLVALSLACSLPVIGQPKQTTPEPSATPTELPTPTLPAVPLPPDLVESDPPLGEEVPLEGPITLYSTSRWIVDRSKPP
jgi:hypothetical protein